MDINDALDVLDGLARDAAAYRAGRTCPVEERVDPSWIYASSKIAAKVVVNFVAPADTERQEQAVDTSPRR